MQIAVIISPVRVTVGIWRRLLIFQSFRQLTSFSVCVAAAFAIGGLGAPLVLPALESKANWPVVALISVLVGSLPSAIGAIPSAFSIITQDEGVASFIQRLDEGIRLIGYHVFAKNRDRTSYSTSHPAWLRWNENTIVVEIKSPRLIVVTGPLFSLSRLRDRLSESVKRSGDSNGSAE